MRSRSRSPRSSSYRERSRNEPSSRSREIDRERDRYVRDSRRDYHRDRREHDRSPNERMTTHRRRSRSIEHRERYRGEYDRGRDRERNRRRKYKSGSPSRDRRRSNSRSRSPKAGAVPKYLMSRPEITDKDLEGKTEEEQEMMKLMGFGNFDTTKGKHVKGNDVSAVNVLQKRKYRQYMNRKGGFNRPLDFVA